jgi:hypothetical protein
MSRAGGAPRTAQAVESGAEVEAGGGVAGEGPLTTAVAARAGATDRPEGEGGGGASISPEWRARGLSLSNAELQSIFASIDIKSVFAIVQPKHPPVQEVTFPIN